MHCFLKTSKKFEWSVKPKNYPDTKFSSTNFAPPEKNIRMNPYTGLFNPNCLPPELLPPPHRHRGHPWNVPSSPPAQGPDGHLKGKIYMECFVQADGAGQQGGVTPSETVGGGPVGRRRRAAWAAAGAELPAWTPPPGPRRATSTSGVTRGRQVFITIENTWVPVICRDGVVGLLTHINTYNIYNIYNCCVCVWKCEVFPISIQVSCFWLLRWVRWINQTKLANF